MRTLNFSVAIFALMALSDQVKAIDWEKHVYDEQEIFKDIPDQINMEETRFRFKLIHWFLTGIDRGLYNDTQIVLDEDCFGDTYV